jgi:hypothetical protein
MNDARKQQDGKGQDVQGGQDLGQAQVDNSNHHYERMVHSHPCLINTLYSTDAHTPSSVPTSRTTFARWSANRKGRTERDGARHAMRVQSLSDWRKGQAS